MSKKITKLIAVAGLLCFGSAQAQEIRSPLSLYRGPHNFRYSPLPDIEDKKWSLDAWAAGYGAIADRAYLAHGTGTHELGALFFNQQWFRLADAFPAQGACADFSKYPCIALTEIKPNLEYVETGVYMGATIGGRCDNNAYRMGLRVQLPFRDIKVENNSCCSSTGCLDKVRSFQREKVTDSATNIVQSYAYRLDFLSTLNDLDFPAAIASPLVKYSNPNASGNITIVEQDIANNKVVTALRSNSGLAPTGKWGTTLNQLDAVPLNGNGSGPGNGQRGEFIDGTNYSALGNSQNTQASLWVVPTYQNDGITITPGAEAIRNSVELAVESIDDISVEEFLLANCISLESQRERGVGDLRTEAFVGTDLYDWLYGELQLAVQWPTAKSKNPWRALEVQPGNNGHVELQAGVYFGFDAADWLKIGVDGLYSQVLKHNECVAATFKGACVKGLGPAVKARIDWNWFLGHVNFTFLHPKDLELGANIGYELYAKGEDNIKFREQCACDLLGNLAELDSSVIKNRTDRIVHKINFEIFKRFDFLEIFAGSSYTFLGRNALRFDEAHLGLNINANWDRLFS